MSHRKSSKKRSVKGLGDVTLNDFANAAVTKTRLKKSTSNVVTVLKQFEEEKTWDEKTEDFEGDFVQQLDEEGNITYVLRKPDPRRRKKTLSSSDETSDDNGNSYPIDIWFLLSEYIRPEDVGRFAGICRSAHEVVSTAKFWYGLYKRYYVSTPNMPEELQMESLVRKYGLRTSVIRALYFMYQPYVNKLKLVSTTLENHPDDLKKRVCDSLWHTKKGHWVFYFKLKENTENTSLKHSRSEFKRPDLLEILEDVSANPDENCRILQVTCKHFVPVPPVIGQVLTSVSLTLSHGLRHHRLQLGFGSGTQWDVKTNHNNTVVLDPVINYRILDWWHPLYPHNHSLQDLVDQD